MRNLFLLWWWEKYEFWEEFVAKFIQKLWTEKKNILLLGDKAEDKTKKFIIDSWNHMSHHNHQFLFPENKSDVLLPENIELIKNGLFTQMVQ